MASKPKPSISERRGFTGKLILPPELVTMPLTRNGYRPVEREDRTSYTLFTNHYISIPPKSMVPLHTGVLISKPIEGYVVFVDQSPRMLDQGIITAQAVFPDHAAAIVVHAFNTTDAAVTIMRSHEVGIIRIQPKIPFVVKWDHTIVGRTYKRYMIDSDSTDDDDDDDRIYIVKIIKSDAPAPSIPSPPKLTKEG